MSSRKAMQFRSFQKQLQFQLSRKTMQYSILWKAAGKQKLEMHVVVSFSRRGGTSRFPAAISLPVLSNLEEADHTQACNQDQRHHQIVDNRQKLLQLPLQRLPD